MTVSSESVRKTVFKSLIALCIPAVIEEIMATLMLYVDTAMVGHLGEQATASVSASGSINWLIVSSGYALSVPFLALISKACGERNYERAKRLSAHALWFVVVFGLILTAICLSIAFYVPYWMRVENDIIAPAGMYFFIVNIPVIFKVATAVFAAAIRGTQDTRTPMLVNLLANVINIILNAILIYGAGLGVIGAAVASAISITFSGVLMIYFYRKIPSIRWDKSHLAPDKKTVLECLRIAGPTLATSVTSCMGYVFFAAMVSGMGTTIFAAHAIAVSAEELFYVPAYGFETATATAIGYAIGENDSKKLKITEEVSIVVTILVMLATGILLFLVANPLMHLFTNSPPVIELGAQMLMLVALTEPFFGLMNVMQGIFYGMGKTKGVFIIMTSSMWGIRILFTFFVTNVWMLDLRYVWYCMIADNIVKAVLLMLLYLNMRRKRKYVRISA